MPDYSIFEAGDVVLQSGLTYRGAKLAYKTTAHSMPPGLTNKYLQ
jgi:hypothetical protein